MIILLITPGNCGKIAGCFYADNLHYEKFQDGTVKCIENEIPFEIPEGWEWARLNSVSENITDGDHQPPPQTTTGIPFLVISDVVDGTLHFENTRHVSEEYYQSLSEYRKARCGDILFTVTGSYGIPVPVNTKNTFCFQRHIGIIRPCIVDYLFLALVLGSNHIKTLCDLLATGIAQKTVGLSTLRNFMIPLPPLNEQIKIIAAVNGFQEAVDVIFAEQIELNSIIKSVKSKVLDLAIRGKLVPQDPNDEPASVLLERIRAEKEDLIKAGKIKRGKKESVIFKGEDNSYYLQTGKQAESLDDWQINDLPQNWTICCLGEICNYGDCVNVNSNEIEDTAWVLDLEDIEKDTGVVIKKVPKKERDSVSTKHQFCSGQVLYSKLRPYLNKVVLADQDGYCTSEILPLDLCEAALPKYIRFYLMSPTFLAYADRCSYGVKMPRLGTTDGKNAIVTLPPFAEQQRIVAAIETYFALLDQIAESLS